MNFLKTFTNQDKIFIGNFPVSFQKKCAFFEDDVIDLSNLSETPLVLDAEVVLDNIITNFPVVRFQFRPIADSQRKFVYIQQGPFEDGKIARLDLKTGKFDLTPIDSSYGFSYRQSDGSLFTSSRLVGNRLKRYSPASWNVDEPLDPTGTSVDATDFYSELSVYNPNYDAIINPTASGFLTSSIKKWDADTLSSSLFVNMPDPYAVHGIHWEYDRNWWIGGDSGTPTSGNSRWGWIPDSDDQFPVIFNNLPTKFGSSIIPFLQFDRVVLVGCAFEGRWVSINRISTGEVLHFYPGFGSAIIGGCFKIPSLNQVVIFDMFQTQEIRVINAINGEIVKSIQTPPNVTYGTGCYVDLLKSWIAFPFVGANVNRPNSDILIVPI
jgi:hypothetical protein